MGPRVMPFVMAMPVLPCLLDGKWADYTPPVVKAWTNACKFPLHRLTYTWLVDGRPAKISAPKFINRVEKWIVSKIHDPVMFPTRPVPGVPVTYAIHEADPTVLADDWIGKSSGFPQTFYTDCQGIMKQMFRCYAHIYHAHWLNPFWHTSKHDVLNMCFVHFVTVAKYYKLVADKEMEPMQPLINLFIKQQRIPPEALNGGHWGQQTVQPS